MTKAELEKDRDEWKRQAESLQDDLDALNEAYFELEEKNYELSNQDYSNTIDLDNLKRCMQIDGLWSVEFEIWLENFMRYNA